MATPQRAIWRTAEGVDGHNSKQRADTISQLVQPGEGASDGVIDVERGPGH